MKATIVLFALLAACQPSIAEMACPVGSYAWSDGWGNRTCRSFETKQDVITETDPNTGRPRGATESYDKWGNKISKGFGPTNGTTYYSTSGGCPLGSHPWYDKWGNPICQH